ncbi:DNA polymerase III subunit gamma/tau [Helicobacter sp. 11S02596-1]|uniref:DNA polymerase III subunit gamma/tau n=1 Tax=Helicobacter sp. 11S02596-1 TaxID=1476194 RepID=UPI000BD640BC|nr:DNA polymerase III subunit gamma/tau [Helicobacter sp. 11S02596-1]PAF45144.1 hypothetical protein BJI48_00840 [Helicobacter sp. 11S02596-1]
MALALALKYRPTQFSDLIGQESVSQTLSMALDHSRISHAYLFSGLRGSGKTSSARIFSRALQCEKGPTSTPCGECDNCKSALQGRHLDIIEMDAASSRKIDDIRDLIEQTKYYPSYGRYKIFIIDEVHMLTKEAFNALLKTLEEPPSYVKFILATTDPLKLPATILSRTQHFRFKKIPHRAVVTHIANILDKENVKYEPEALEIIARSGSGSLRDTLTIADQAISFCNQHITTAKVTEMLGVVDPQTLREFFNAIFQHQHAHNEASGHNDKLEEILAMLQDYECEMIVDEMTLFLKDALHSRDKDFPIVLVDRFLRILSESKNLLHMNAEGGFVLLLLSLKMQEAMKVRDIDSMIATLESSLAISQNALPKTPMPSPQTQLQTHSSNEPQKDTPNEQISPTRLPKIDRTDLFAVLLDKIYDRSQNLGEIFEKNITFVSFEDSVLCWKSRADGEERTILAQNYAHIKMMVQEIYGVSTKIKSIQDETPPPKPSNSEPLNPSPSNSAPSIPPLPQTPPNPEILPKELASQPQNAPSKAPQSEQAQDTQPGPESTPEPALEPTKPPQERFLEENKELINNIKIHLGATEMIVLEKKNL